MGFPSYKEDIERAREDWDHLRQQLGEAHPSGDPEAHLRALREACDRLAAKFDALLELATDPDLQLAHEVVALRKDRNDLKSMLGTNDAKHAQEIAEFKRARSELESAYAGLRRKAEGDLAAKEREVRSLQEKISKLQQTLEFERAGRADFGSAVDRFPPPRPTK